MEPSEAVNQIETALRLVIEACLGPKWLSAKGAPSQGVLEERQRVDTARRDGATISKNLLDFTMTTDLSKIILANWDKFKPVFGDKKRFEVDIGRVEDFRNPVAHTRALLPFERELLSGVAGQIRNQVSLFRSQVDNPSAQYYPLIERVSDSFGNVPTLYGQSVTRLNVGDEVVIEATAFDSTGRELQWTLFATTSNNQSIWPYQGMPNWLRIPEAQSQSGTQVQLRVTIEPEQVGESFALAVFLTTPGKYHRHPAHGSNSQYDAYDDCAFFFYAVNPPVDD